MIKSNKVVAPRVKTSRNSPKKEVATNGPMGNQRGGKKPDPALHIRKRVAGGAAGTMVGAAVAGPVGALIGGVLGTVVGVAAETARPRTGTKTSSGSATAARRGAGKRGSQSSATARKQAPGRR